MKFAFIIMGTFGPQEDRAKIHNGAAQIIGVSNIDEACAVAKALQKEGIDCIELCGAFGESGAKRIIETTENQVPIGYVTHLAEQEHLFQLKFGNS